MGSMNIDAGQSFNFLPVPTDIYFGFGVRHSLPERMGALDARHAFIVTDPGIKASGMLDEIVETLTKTGIAVTVCDRVKADSSSTLIDTTVKELKSSGAEVVLGIGGGSSLDTAKAIALLATNAGSCIDYVGLNKARTRPLPMIAIPTTSGTGSEVTLWSVFTDESCATKVAIGGVLVYPAIAVCDPELTLNLPPHLTSSTGMDALAHAIECYTNNACQPISACLALRAIELIGQHLRSAVLNGRNRNARYGMMLASTMAGIAMNPTRLGLAHALAMPLGSWDMCVPHGVALAVTLPVVMEYNHLAAADRFVEVARALGEPVEDLTRLEAARRAVDAVQKLAQDIGIPNSLSSFGVGEQHVGPVVAEAMKSGNVPVNPRLTRSEDLETILRQVL
jgi:alcohol dehydrogenase class IV